MWLDGLRLPADGGGQARQAARIVLTGDDSRDQQIPYEFRILHARPVNLRVDLAVQAAAVHVAHHSHDGPQFRQPMTDRVLVGEEAPRQRFVDDYYSRGFRAVLRCKWSSCANLDAHRLKVFGADEIGVNTRLFPRLLMTPLDLNKKEACRPGER